jgi:hypothetical protein
MEAKKCQAAKDAEFGASRGWFDRFKKRSNLLNIKVQCQAAAADSFPRDLAKIIDDGGYMKDGIFNVDETGLFWKKRPSRTFTVKEEKTILGFKPTKDGLALPLGANASGTLNVWSPTLSPSAMRTFWHLKSRGKKKMCLKRWPVVILKV